MSLCHYVIMSLYRYVIISLAIILYGGLSPLHGGPPGFLGAHTSAGGTRALRCFRRPDCLVAAAHSPRAPVTRVTLVGFSASQNNFQTQHLINHDQPTIIH